MAEALIARFQKRFPGGRAITIEDMQLALGDPASSRQGSSPLISVLFGPSGAGKTTVLRCLAGLERPESGTIQFGSEMWFSHERFIFARPQERNIGYLSQDYALFPHLTVENNIAYGLRSCTSAEREMRVGELIRMLELRGIEKRLPGEISGGEQQRVALARAVARRPRMLLLDEPLSALDAPTRLRLRGELRRLLRQLGIPALVVTHDRLEALALGDHLVIMNDGAVLQSGPVQDVFSRPANLAVAGIVAVETVQSGRVVESRDDLLTVAVGEAKLTALRWDLPAGVREVFVCIRGEDVILMKRAQQAGSARNHLQATISALTHEGPVVRIALDCGFALSALLTKQAVEEMDLQPNDKVMALVKAPNVHVIAR